ncbi:hypothetical protein DV515_00015289 [Chloebia gouldiae]|uniref:Uncharacterized protein n=1 Tax=Chloebia gouldiae TaxID=44316 RepID=A0A3L8RWZ3_CHLGU|nr:hypothetical protein DV515_00015289 [Chloebia gouldiae]
MAGGQIPLGMTHGQSENTLGSEDKGREHQTALLFHAGGIPGPEPADSLDWEVAPEHPGWSFHHPWNHCST